MSKKTYLIALHGPYHVDYTDLPSASSGGGTIDLWVPTVGDVLLRVFPDFQAAARFSAARQVFIKHSSYIVATAYNGNNFTVSSRGHGLDNIPGSVLETVNGEGITLPGSGVISSAYVFHNNDPVQIGWIPADTTNPLADGHVDLYALVAHPVGE